MSGRSSPRSALALALVCVAACGSRSARPKGSVERVRTLAAYMVDNSPRPGVVGECKPGELLGGYPMTHLTLLKLGKKTWQAERPEYADWINPPELDAPSARVLLAGTPGDALDEAAGEFQAAKFYVVYRVENVDAPLALGVKDPKPSTVGTHITKYGKDTIPVCSTVFHFQSSKRTTDWAIAHSDRAVIDPRVAQAMREDLTAQFQLLAPRVFATAPAP